MSILKPAGERTAGQELGQAGRRAVPIFVAIGVVVVLIGLLITKVLSADFDAGVDRWFAEHRGPTLNTLTHYGTLFGETVTIVACTAITVVVFRVVFHRWRESVILLACVVGQSLIFLSTTILIDRKRPPVPHLDDSPPTSSFPSGHTAASTAFWAGTGLIIAWHTRDRWWGRLIAALGLLIPIAVATCRMYRGMHFPSDTLTSYLFALALLAVAFRALPLGEGARDRVLTPLRAG